jgi:hypothetical protein
METLAEILTTLAYLLLTPVGQLLVGAIMLLVLGVVFLAKRRDRLQSMDTSLYETGESQYDVVVDNETIGRVWNWHGTWSAQVDGKTYHGLKSRKQAIERVERIYQLRGQ